MKKIIIIGAGPTGLMAALTLCRRGVKARIIDKKIAPISTSNALAVQPRTLEIWKELAVVDEALKEGHPLEGISICKEGKRLGQLTFKQLPTQYPFVLTLPQAKTEQLLALQLEKCGVAVERGIALTAVSVKDSGVEVTLGNTTESYDYVIGCDGAMSTARISAGIPFKGRDLPQHFIMADLHVKWNKSANFGHLIYSEKGILAFLPIDNQNNGRLIADVTYDEGLKAKKQPTLEDFSRIMHIRSQESAYLDQMKWSSSFMIHSKIAGSYQKLGMFLAGDAAHLHSPVGGQGMNTGIQDAYFLANLLADVMEGKEEKVLQEYTRVRRSIGKTIVRRTDFITRLISSRSKLAQKAIAIVLPFMFTIPSVTQRAAMTISQLIYR